MLLFGSQLYCICSKQNISFSHSNELVWWMLASLPNCFLPRKVLISFGQYFRCPHLLSNDDFRLMNLLIGWRPTLEKKIVVNWELKLYSTINGLLKYSYMHVTHCTVHILARYCQNYWFITCGSSRLNGQNLPVSNLNFLRHD